MLKALENVEGWQIALVVLAGLSAMYFYANYKREEEPEDGPTTLVGFCFYELEHKRLTGAQAWKATLTLFSVVNAMLTAARDLYSYNEKIHSLRLTCLKHHQTLLMFLKYVEKNQITELSTDQEEHLNTILGTYRVTALALEKEMLAAGWEHLRKEETA